MPAPKVPRVPRRADRNAEMRRRVFHQVKDMAHDVGLRQRNRSAPLAFLLRGELCKECKMARRYSRGASKTVASAMRRRKRGTLKSGRSGKTVKSRKQAIAIGLSEARKKGKKVPKRKSR